MSNFDWNSFLETAKNLSEGDSEAEKRSAISRAYYAAFNVAKKCRNKSCMENFWNWRRSCILYAEDIISKIRPEI